MLTSSKLYAKEFSFDTSSNMKLIIYQKLRNFNGNTFSFIPHVYYFSYHPWIAASEARSLTAQEHQHPCPILLEFRHSSPPLFKNYKKPEVHKKFKHARHIDRESFVFSSYRDSKESVSRLLTLNWLEHFIWWDYFQICCGSNNKTLLLYACEVIHLINKSVISRWVQE